MAQIPVGKPEEVAKTINPKDMLSAAKETLSATKEVTKEAIGAAIQKARGTININGESVIGETQRFIGDYVGKEGMYTSALKTPFNATGELLKLNPVGVVRELAEGAGKTIASMVDAVTSPARMAVIAGKEIALFPGQALSKVANSPLAVFNTLQNGFNRITTFLNKT